MSSWDHEGVVELFRREPKLVAERLGGPLGIEQSPDTGASMDSGALTQLNSDLRAKGCLLGPYSEPRGLAGQENASYPTFMNNVRDILDAIRGLPPAERLRLVEELTSALESEPANDAPSQPPPGSNLEIRSGFYVYTGAVGDPSVLDHRLARDERIDHLARGSSARRD